MNLVNSGAFTSWKAFGEFLEVRREELRQLRGGEEDDDLRFADVRELIMSE